MDAIRAVSALRCLECKLLVREDSSVTCPECYSVFHVFCVGNRNFVDGNCAGASNQYWKCKYCCLPPGSLLRGQSNPDHVDPRDLESRLKIIIERVICLLSEYASLKGETEKFLKDMEIIFKGGDPRQGDKNDGKFA